MLELQCLPELATCGSHVVSFRQGLFAKRRQLILTDAPRLYYIDPVDMELKGEIPWSDALQVEQKNWKIFFIHTVRAPQVFSSCQCRLLLHLYWNQCSVFLRFITLPPIQPNRTYYLEDPTGNSQDWCSTIGKWKKVYLQRKKETSAKH